MELFGLSGYILASISYFIFILLLLAARNNTLAGRLVLLGSIVTLISYALGAFQLQMHFSLKLILFFETLRLPIWSILLIATKENIYSASDLLKNKRSKEYLLVWLILSLVCWGVTLIGDGDNKYLFMLFLMLNLWALVLLEQLYRNIEVKSKWALRPLVLSLGGVGVFEFILFAQASMLNQLNFDLWYFRSLVAIIAMPLLLISTRRMKDWSVNVFISRDVVFYSSMLMITGLYLLVMAFSGYVLNYIGAEWGSMLSITFLVMGGIVLTVLLMTEKLRREVRVFITKHFFANKYDYRVEWLKLIAQLEISDSDDYYQTALNTICSALKAEKGLLIRKIALGNYNTLCGNGIELTNTLSKELRLVDEYCLDNEWIIDLREYQKVENSYAELFIDSSLFRRMDIGIIVPIVVNKKLYGYFLLSHFKDIRRLLNWEDRDLLAAISKQLSHFISSNEASEELSEAKQFDAFNRMSAFLVHDLKNVQAQLTLITTNAKRHRNNPEFVDDVFETVSSASDRLDKTLKQLRNKQVMETSKKSINVNSTIEKVIARRNIDNPKVSFVGNENIDIVVDKETFDSVINHLIQNAQEATSENGWVNIEAIMIDENLKVIISDNGSGMSKEFIKNRLFKPFDTTKGNAGMGIGVFEAKQFIENIGGSMLVASEENKGTTFTLLLPTNT